jgi:hypothetical protein
METHTSLTPLFLSWAHVLFVAQIPKPGLGQTAKKNGLFD